MEINDIIKLMQAVTENGLTSFKLEEENLTLSIKREKEIAAAAGTSVPVMASGAAGLMMQPQFPEGGQVYGQSGSPAFGQISGQSSDSAGNAAISSDKVISSPLVGTFYNAPSPDSEPFVGVGDTVKKGQTLGVIEAMKLMNEIECEYDGVVEAILVSNEDVVEYGQPLFRIR